MRKEFSPRVVLKEFCSFFIVFAVLFFALLRIPSLIEPAWYGDEGIYQVVGMALSEGRALYSEIWDNKPPLLYIVYAVFNGNLFQVKLASLLVGALSIIVFFLLARKLFQSSFSRIISTILFVLFFGSPILEGNIANAENFMLLPVITAFLSALVWMEQKKMRYLILSGSLLSIAFLFKTVALFDFAALLIILLLFTYQKIPFTKDLKRYKKETRDLLFFSGAFILPLIITSLYFLFQGTFVDFLSAVFFENVGYINVENQAVFPVNFVFVKLLLMVVGIAVLYIIRNRFKKSELFILVWLILALFSAFFSQRPYTHYILVALPALSLLAGALFESSKRALLLIGVFVVAISLLYFQFPYYKKWVAYYRNFGDFIFHEKPIESYQAFFDPNTPRDYEIANLMKEKVSKGDSVYIWSDSAQIYSLLGILPPGKYIVAYHITFYENAIKETKNQLTKSEPKYVIQTLKMPDELDLGQSYAVRYQIKDAYIYERQY